MEILEIPLPVTLINGRSKETVVDLEFGVEDDVDVRALNTKFHSKRLKRGIKTFPFFIVIISLIQILTHYLGEGDLSYYLGYDPHRRHEVWRFLTIMFVHSGGKHLWNNLIGQLYLGVPLEIVHRWKRIGMIYLGGVLGSVLFVTVFEPKVYAVGSSGAGYALFFAYTRTLILNWKEINGKFYRVVESVAFTVINVYDRLNEGSNDRTSHPGHCGGAVMGFLISILVLKTFVSHPWPWEKTFRNICARILVTLTLLIVIINIGVPAMYCESHFNTDYYESRLLFYFKTIEESPSPGESPFLIKCLKSKVCADIWAAYKSGIRPLNATLLFDE